MGPGEVIFVPQKLSKGTLKALTGGMQSILERFIELENALADIKNLRPIVDFDDEPLMQKIAREALEK